MSRKNLFYLSALIITVALPITLILVKHQQNNRSHAASPDQLEAEGGVLGGNAKIQTDSLASGGNYVLFGGFSITSGPISQSVTANSVEITWTLSENGTGQVEYGTTTSYGTLSTPENSFTYSTHIQTLSGLTAGTTYHYRVKSTNQAGIQVVSADNTSVTVGGSGTTPTPTPSTGVGPTYPAILNQLPTGPANYPIPPRPGYMQSIIDPQYGAKITRITNTPGIHTPYSGQYWSKDNNYFITDQSSMHLFNGNTYQDYGPINANNNGHLLFSNTVDDLAYTTNSYGAPNLYWYKPSTNTWGIKRSFANDGYTVMKFGSTVTLSHDDRTLAMKGVKNGEWWIMVYNPLEDIIVAEWKWVHPDPAWQYLTSEPKSVSTSKRGTYIMVGRGIPDPEGSQGNWFYTRTGTYIRPNPLGVAHQGHAYDTTNNREVVFQGGSMARYDTGGAFSAAPYVPDPGNQVSYNHVTTTVDGWAYGSTGNSSWDPSVLYGYDMISALKTDGSGKARVWGFTWTHAPWNIGGAAYPGYPWNYDQVFPYPYPNRDGSKIIFSSRWQTATQYGQEVYMYVAEMPK